MGLRLSLLGPVICLGLAACGNEIELVPDGATGNTNSVTPLDATFQLDIVTQVPVPVVDVLYVVDNSGSMSTSQAKLNENFPKFMQYFLDSGLDYHIGVTSTDCDYTGAGNQGALVPKSGYDFVDADTLDPVDVFRKMANLGTSGSATEMGRRAAYSALELKRDSVNAGFMRDEATQHIVFVSDELDQSGGNPVSQPEFMAWMSGLKAAPDMTVAHVIEPKTNAACDMSDGFGGNRYKSYSDATGGVWFNMCSPTDEWGGFLEELGLQTSGLKREFFLSKTPIPASIKVTVTQPDEATGQSVTFEFTQDPDANPAFKFTYDRARNSIRFDEFIPNSFADVKMSYDLLESAGSIDETL